MSAINTIVKIPVYVTKTLRKKDRLWLASIIGIMLLLVPILLLLYYGFAVFHLFSGLNTVLFRSIELTLAASGLSAAITFLVFTPLSYELARRSHRIMDIISDIPASIPHPIVGIAILLLDSPITPTGRFLLSIGINFFDTIAGMTVALSFVSAPIYIRAVQSLLSSNPVDPEIYGKTLGMGRLHMLYSILIPQESRGFLSASLTAMSRGMSEFGSIAIVSYYIIGGYFNGVEPVSVLIYKQYGYSGPALAVTSSAILIIVSMLVLLAIKLLPLPSQKNNYHL